jgi:hypothetical protein
MLTIFCSPKPFINEADWNQRNALRSWKAIHPDVEIYIFGSPAGAGEAASEINAVLVPEVDCSPSGAPSFNAMERYICQHGRYDFQLYVNCDIILNATVLIALRECAKIFNRFLIVGERLDLVKGEVIDVCDTDWMKNLLSMAKSGYLRPHGPTGVDYFGFTRGIWQNLGTVYMGRALCDQALLNFCLQQNIPIIETTQSVMAIHQFHDYHHVEGGKQEVFFGKDRTSMANEHHLAHSLPIITDAEWMFSEDGSITRGRRTKLRHWELILRYQYQYHWLAYFFRALQYLGGSVNSYSTNFSKDDILISWERFLESI